VTLASRPSACSRRQARNSVLDADVVLTVVDGSEGRQRADKVRVPRIQGLDLGGADAPFRHILLVNKVDKLTPRQRAGILESLLFRSLNPDSPVPAYDEALWVSALRGDGVPEVEALLRGLAPTREWLYPADVRVSHSPQKAVEEEIREQVFAQLHREIPYTLFQRNLHWEEAADGGLTIVQALVVKNNTQKRMVIGKRGAVINGIRSAAEGSIGAIFNVPVTLDIVAVVDDRPYAVQERVVS